MLRKELVKELAMQTRWSASEWDDVFNVVHVVTPDVIKGVSNYGLRMGASPNDTKEILMMLQRLEDTEK